MTHRILPVLMSILMAGQAVPAVLAASSPDVNFKIYSPSEQPPESQSGATAGTSSTPAQSDLPAATPATSPASADTSAPSASPAPATAGAAETPVMDTSNKTQPAAEAAPATTDANPATPSEGAKAEGGTAEPPKVASKVLQGYIRVVPSGTKIPIIMDTAIDSDTSQEGDEFSARTSEDLTIDGGIVVPAGSVIKGRIAQLNAARRFDRSGSVALKFDTVTTPDNRQIPIVANIVARGGVVHARRGMKDIAIETGMVALPTAAGVGIGFLAGNASKSSSIKGAGGALIGAGIGVAVGAIVLMAKKGKRVDVRPGDELKIELAEDLRMPM